HAAPGAHAHDRADPERLGGGVDDVAVGAGVLVGHQHDGAAGCLVRVGAGLGVVPPHPPADDLRGQPRDHELAGVTAAVVAHVGDEALGADRVPQVAVQLRPAVAHHG